jgi:hypothetical protein
MDCLVLTAQLKNSASIDKSVATANGSFSIVSLPPTIAAKCTIKLNLYQYMF